MFFTEYLAQLETKCKTATDRALRVKGMIGFESCEHCQKVIEEGVRLSEEYHIAKVAQTIVGNGPLDQAFHKLEGAAVEMVLLAELQFIRVAKGEPPHLEYTELGVAVKQFMLQMKMEELRAKIRASLVQKVGTLSQGDASPPPRYDDVFYQGTMWLDGCIVKEVCMQRRCFKIMGEDKVEVPFESLLRGDVFTLIDEGEGGEDGKMLYVAESDAYLNPNNIWEIVSRDA